MCHSVRFCLAGSRLKCDYGNCCEAYHNEGKGPLHTYSIDYEDNAKYFKANDFQPNADGPWIEKMTQAFQTEASLFDYIARDY